MSRVRITPLDDTGQSRLTAQTGATSDLDRPASGARMILDGGVYRKGVRSALPTDPVSAAKALSEDPECIAWVDLYEPEDDEIALVQQLFSLHELAVEDARTSHQRPKIEQYEDSLVVVLPTAVPVSIRLPLKMS